MRIYGNRLLKTLPGQLTRPTSSRVREALFNIWQGKIKGCHWLDLCTGIGSMGAEALCRGAAKVVGIEQSGKACGIIKANWQKMAANTSNEGEFLVIRGDVLAKLKDLQGQTFHRIYFDPPYASDLYAPVLEAVSSYQLLAWDGEMAVEGNSSSSLPLEISGLVICREKKYGNTVLTFYETI